MTSYSIKLCMISDTKQVDNSVLTEGVDLSAKFVANLNCSMQTAERS